MTGLLELTAVDVEAMDEARAQEALAAWVKARKVELPLRLAESGSKLHARLAKKALYQLKSVGVQVAEPPKDRLPAAAPLETGADELPGAMSAFLGTGERAIFFARPVRGGGLDLYQGILNDTKGVMQLDRGESNRGTWRRRMKELENDPNLKVLLLPWKRMKAELGRALAMNERAGTPLPKDADVALRRLGVEPENPDLLLPEPLPDDASLATRGATLHQENEIAEWLPSEEHLKVLTARLDEVQASPLALSDAQKREQREQKARLTAKEALTKESREIYARRLWYMADLFDASKRQEAAKLSRAVARRLFHVDEPTAFVDQLFLKVLELAPPPAPPAPPARAGAMPMPPGLVVP